MATCRASKGDALFLTDERQLFLVLDGGQFVSLSAFFQYPVVARGIDGNTGAQGATGPRGEKGEQGERGVGERGLQGPAGERGLTGTGERGPRGEKGDRGDSIVGPMGPQGPRGERGERGYVLYCDSAAIESAAQKLRQEKAKFAAELQVWLSEKGTPAGIRAIVEGHLARLNS